MMIIVRCLAWGLLLSFSVGAEEAPYKRALQQIPIEDQQILADFFKGLLSRGHFAFTFFGQKPATSFDYPCQFISNLDAGPLKSRFLLEARAWKLWEKYQSLFTFTHFLFLKQKSSFPSFLFVNTSKMQAVLREHREFFLSHFSQDPLEGDLAAFLLHAFVTNFRLNNFHLAQGLLLGYEEASCMDFQKRVRIEDTVDFFPYDVEGSRMMASAAPDSLLDGYPQSLIAEREEFNKQFTMKRHWPDTNPFFCSSSSGYMSFEAPNDPVAQELKGKIIALYNHEFFLEEFLRILTQ